MACFLVSAAEATVVSIASKVIEKKENDKGLGNETSLNVELPAEEKVPFSRKLKWLSYLQWGGSALLAFEHLWHGEIVPFPPFLTAMADAGDAAEMFHEMATVGVSMAVLTTLVWVGMLVVSHSVEKKAGKDKAVNVSE